MIIKGILDDYARKFSNRLSALYSLDKPFDAWNDEKSFDTAEMHRKVLPGPMRIP